MYRDVGRYVQSADVSLLLGRLRSPSAVPLADSTCNEWPCCRLPSAPSQKRDLLRLAKPAQKARHWPPDPASTSAAANSI